MIIYTAEAVRGGNVERRIAREKLQAIVEEILVKEGLVTQYAITDSKKFPFPVKKPDFFSLDNFFGDKPDHNAVVTEINELYEHPKKVLADFVKDVEQELELDSDEDILKKIETFHFAPINAKQIYLEVKAKIKKLWKPYDKISSHLESLGDDSKREALLCALSALDDFNARGLMAELQTTERLLKEGKREEAIDKVRMFYNSWMRKNLEPLYNLCTDAIVYENGFWMARLVAPDKPVEKEYNKPRTAEEALKRLEKAFQVV